MACPELAEEGISTSFRARSPAPPSRTDTPEPRARSPLRNWTHAPPKWTHPDGNWTHFPRKWTHSAKNWTHWPRNWTHCPDRVNTSQVPPAPASSEPLPPRSLSSHPIILAFCNHFVYNGSTLSHPPKPPCSPASSACSPLPLPRRPRSFFALRRGRSRRLRPTPSPRPRPRRRWGRPAVPSQPQPSSPARQKIRLSALSPARTPMRGSGWRESAPPFTPHRFLPPSTHSQAYPIPTTAGCAAAARPSQIRVTHDRLRRSARGLRARGLGIARLSWRLSGCPGDGMRSGRTMPRAPLIGLNPAPGECERRGRGVDFFYTGRPSPKVSVGLVRLMSAPVITIDGPRGVGEKHRRTVTGRAMRVCVRG